MRTCVGLYDNFCTHSFVLKRLKAQTFKLNNFIFIQDLSILIQQHRFSETSFSKEKKSYNLLLALLGYPIRSTQNFSFNYQNDVLENRCCYIKINKCWLNVEIFNLKVCTIYF